MKADRVRHAGHQKCWHFFVEPLNFYRGPALGVRGLVHSTYWCQILIFRSTGVSVCSCSGGYWRSVSIAVHGMQGVGSTGACKKNSNFFVAAAGHHAAAPSHRSGSTSSAFARRHATKTPAREHKQRKHPPTPTQWALFLDARYVMILRRALFHNKNTQATDQRFSFFYVVA